MWSNIKALRDTKKTTTITNGYRMNKELYLSY
jgi:hypothetical protein